jgi:hypothetical protein
LVGAIPYFFYKVLIIFHRIDPFIGYAQSVHAKISILLKE